MKEVTRRFIEQAAQRRWVAAIDDGGTWHSNEVLDAARELAEAVGVFGLVRPTLLVQSENTHRMVVLALAAGLLDAALALASPHLTAGDVADVIDDVRPDLVIGDPEQLGRWGIKTPAAGRPVLDHWVVLKHNGPLQVHAAADDRWNGGVLLGMTSGSTGRSKAVVHSESALQYAVRQEIAVVGLQPGDAIGVIVPLSAAPAFTFGIYASLELQSAALLSGEWEPAAALRQLAEHQARWLMCVPTQVLQLAAASSGAVPPLAGMKAMTVGGGPMDTATLQETEKALGVPVLRVFGMAECLGHTSPALDDPPAIRLGRDGRPFPGTDVRALGPDGRQTAVGEPGRAQVRGPSLFLGYAKSGSVVPPELTDDGFFETGDLVAYAPDGTIKVAGRIKEVIIRGGRNISVAEIESALRHIGCVAEACVVPVPDPVLGERVAVLVVPHTAMPTLEDLCRELGNQGLSKIKWPEFIVEVAELPHTHVGKLSRVRAREIATQRLQVEVKG
ncbi:class I adenylate-forming enzyme family protein [Arthrobacter bambusae]|uniref:class I adenylate-forming enzyme family protein n=1 Tax=Arthrobacter bambusae TaxID=1338426 RepID=UPI002780CA03|nr:AMP-binding protein [Arthrobacter bambusae]MDQ0242112.1 acyl-CoA synthetase (AMP-forming)/AMP-acid ligase II [Arthrobacter bambusae]